MCKDHAVNQYVRQFKTSQKLLYTIFKTLKTNRILFFTFYVIELFILFIYKYLALTISQMLTSNILLTHFLQCISYILSPLLFFLPETLCGILCLLIEVPCILHAPLFLHWFCSFSRHGTLSSRNSKTPYKSERIDLLPISLRSFRQDLLHIPLRSFTYSFICKTYILIISATVASDMLPTTVLPPGTQNKKTSLDA